MKKNLIIVAAFAVSALLSSCAHSIYPVETMYTNYMLQMKSEENLAIRSKVQIYFKEADIEGEYAILSCNTYNPPTFLPFHSTKVKKMNKKFLAEAAKKAYDMGGNAILVQSAGFFYVLELKDWNEENAAKMQFVNPILNMKYADLFKSGQVNDMKRGERIRTEKAFMNEIETNIDYVTELKEVKAVRDKITALSNYNLKLKSPKSAITKAVKKDTKKINKAEKKIKKRMEKQKNQKANSKKK